MVLGPGLRELVIQLGDQLIFVLLLVHLGSELIFSQSGLHASLFGLLAEQLVLQLRFLGIQLGLGGVQLGLGFEPLQVQFRIAQFEDDGVGVHDRARLDQDAHHPAADRRGNDQDILGDERANPANLAQHGTPLNRVDPEGPPIHRRRRRFQTRQAQRDQAENDNKDGDKHAPA